MSEKLEWVYSDVRPMLYAISDAQHTGAFRIAYDDVMYWPSWSPDCSQDLDALKEEAQNIHDEWMKLTTITS
jgi:hypothetical protein